MKKKYLLLSIPTVLLIFAFSIIKCNNSQNEYQNYSFYKGENHNRYLQYQKNNNTSIKQSIINVNIGLDKPFYTNVRNAPNQDNNYVLVNKYNYLDKDYIPSDLVKLDKYAKDNIYLKKEAYQAFLLMVNDLLKYDLKIRIISAYRSYNYQKTLYTNYLRQDNVNEVDKYSARPGYSEHQTGLAIDIDNYQFDYTNFHKTKEYSWMLNNAYKYGFILRYPQNKEMITGYQYEPWHYRYVGNIATYIYEHHLTYEEYYYEFIDK